MTEFHDHEYCITSDGVLPGCPNFGEDRDAGALPADEHHFDVVSCDDRPYCTIPQHHAMEDMQ